MTVSGSIELEKPLLNDVEIVKILLTESRVTNTQNLNWKICRN